jgi:hypothetical protein
VPSTFIPFTLSLSKGADSAFDKLTRMAQEDFVPDQGFVRFALRQASSRHLPPIPL